MAFKYLSTHNIYNIKNVVLSVFCIRNNYDFLFCGLYCDFYFTHFEQTNVTYYNAIIQQDDRYASTRIHAVD